MEEKHFYLLATLQIGLALGDEDKVENAIKAINAIKAMKNEDF